MSLRSEFVLSASQDGANIRSLCRHYGISPATGYKWLRRWAEESTSGLLDRPRTPHYSPNRSPDDITDLLRIAHVRHERWGARKIKRWLEDQGHRMPSFSTVHNLMARHGLLPGTAPGIPAAGRFEHDAPNRLWQMDFKGHFPFGGGRAFRSPCWMTTPVSPCVWHPAPMNAVRPCSNSWSACLNATGCQTG